jgi:hypothetical protein
MEIARREQQWSEGQHWWAYCTRARVQIQILIQQGSEKQLVDFRLGQRKK